MRRVVFYLFYDRRGIVDEYVPYKLRALREHAEHIFVVSNSALTSESRRTLEEVADTVWVRENIGYDVGAYQDALAAFGRDHLAEYDEIILMNYTFFAPVYPFAEVFDRMEATDVDFWGITSHQQVDPHPFAGVTGTLHQHLQSHWIAVRRRMFTSLEWRAFWDAMPVMQHYDDSIVHYEGVFTKHFADCGFTWIAAWPEEDYPTEHPVFENAALLLRDRCPIVKRRQFFHESIYLERNAIIGRRVLQALEKTNYPIDLIWKNVVRSAEPRLLYTNFSLLEIVSEEDDGWRPEVAPRIAVVAHVYYEDMVDEIMGYVRNIPVDYDLIVTTTSTAKREAILDALAPYELPRVDVRIVDNRGRDMSALLIGCRDVFESDDYDLVCRVHSKKSPQDSFNRADLFKHHLFDNILYTTGYVANILRLFDRHQTLGMVFPPIVNIGYPTLGHSWFTNRPFAEVVAERISISTLFDSTTPVAPYGSMFWARPQSLRKMAAYPWEWSDYPDNDGYQDGGLPHVQERLLAYTALDAGYHIRSVINRDWGSINYTFLEYKLQKVSAMLPAQTQEQIDYIISVNQSGPFLANLKREVDVHYPRVGKLMRPPYRAARSISNLRSGRRSPEI